MYIYIHLYWDIYKHSVATSVILFTIHLFGFYSLPLKWILSGLGGSAGVDCEEQPRDNKLKLINCGNLTSPACSAVMTCDMLCDLLLCSRNCLCRNISNMYHTHNSFVKLFGGFKVLISIRQKKATVTLKLSTVQPSWCFGSFPPLLLFIQPWH